MFCKKQVIIILVMLTAVLAVIAVVLLTLPKAPLDQPSGESTLSVADVFAPTLDDRVTFTAKVLQVLEKEVLVEPVEGSVELRSASQIYVSLMVRDDEPVPSVQVGDTIEIEYDGLIQETYPAAISTVYAIRLKRAATSSSEPLLKITVAKNKLGKPTHVSTWRTAMKTDYVVYFVDVDSVQVKIGGGYQEILDAIHSESLDINTLRSELMDIAREEYPQSKVIFADGLRDGTPYTETRMFFADYTVTFTGHQSRREVFFSPPNSGGFTQNVQERITEESPKYPLRVVENDDPMSHKITKAAWGLDYDVYYTGIDRATVTVDGKSMDLIYAIDSGRLSFDELVADAVRLEKNDLIRADTIKDGGSKKYYFDGYAILKKHTLNGDRSLYIESR